MTSRELLKRVIEEGNSAWSVTGCSSDVEIHWSIPKELQADIVKYLARANTRQKMNIGVIKTKKGQHKLDLIYDYIVDYIKEYGFPPSIREIVYDCEISSTSVVNYYLEKLEEEGRIKKTPFVARGITVT